MRVERSQGSLRLAQLEDTLHILGMMSAKRIPGRKPNGYRPLQTIDDVRRVMMDTDLHRARAAVG